jgi:hypothetical protein
VAPLSSSTQTAELAGLRRFYRWARSEGVRPDDLSEGIKPRREPYARVQGLNAEEVAALLAVISNDSAARLAPALSGPGLLALSRGDASRVLAWLSTPSWSGGSVRACSGWSWSCPPRSGRLETSITMATPCPCQRASVCTSPYALDPVISHSTDIEQSRLCDGRARLNRSRPRARAWFSARTASG